MADVVDLEAHRARLIARHCGPAPWCRPQAVPDVPTPRDVWRIVRLRDGAVTLTDNPHTAEECRTSGRFRVERYLLVEVAE